jgi:hypothetical protein
MLARFNLYELSLRGKKLQLYNRSNLFYYFNFKTQPVPNPMAYFMHQEPEYFHKFEVVVNHFIELIVPFFVLVPYFRKLTITGGILQIIFQVKLIILA